MSIPIPLLLILLVSSIGAGVSDLIVEVEVERPKEFFRGARCVSLSSVQA